VTFLHRHGSKDKDASSWFQCSLLPSGGRFAGCSLIKTIFAVCREPNYAAGMPQRHARIASAALAQSSKQAQMQGEDSGVATRSDDGDGDSQVDIADSVQFPVTCDDGCALCVANQVCRLASETLPQSGGDGGGCDVPEPSSMDPMCVEDASGEGSVHVHAMQQGQFVVERLLHTLALFRRKYMPDAADDESMAFGEEADVEDPDKELLQRLVSCASASVVALSRVAAPGFAAKLILLASDLALISSWRVDWLEDQRAKLVFCCELCHSYAQPGHGLKYIQQAVGLSAGLAPRLQEVYAGFRSCLLSWPARSFISVARLASPGAFAC